MLTLMMLIYVTILIILMLFSKLARGRPAWSLRATWCPRHRVGDPRCSLYSAADY